MKHIKKFLEKTQQEAYNDYKRICNEVDDIKFILEDEGYIVSCIQNYKNNCVCSIIIDYNCYPEEVWTYINKLVFYPHPNFYIEFKDRIEEICIENGFDYKITNNFAREHSQRIKADTLIFEVYLK